MATEDATDAKHLTGDYYWEPWASWQYIVTALCLIPPITPVGMFLIGWWGMQSLTTEPA